VQLLIVEDEERIAAFLRAGLRSEGFAVDCLEDGDDVVPYVLRRNPDLIVLDLLLPGLGGLEVLGRLGELAAHIPVLVLSARRDVATKIAALQAGACDYMVKPFALDELLLRINGHLRVRRSPSVQPEVVRAGRLVLDPRARSADVGNGPVRLSEREYHVLELLVRGDGQTVSRERLLSAVWGYGFAPGTNVVDVCINRLRGKLGSQTIETVRGAGYAVAV
jgi:DNA-binding response OmpR family regulator